jgi:plastocyanin
MTTSRILLAAIVLIAVVGACSGGSAASVSPPPGADLTITAKGNAFDPAAIRLAADQPVEVFFRNLDGQPHNVAIYTDASASKSVFVGELITDATNLYEIPAIASGDYFFRCDVHPEMTGTLVVEG